MTSPHGLVADDIARYISGTTLSPIRYRPLIRPAMPPLAHITELSADVHFTSHFKTQAFEHIEHPGRASLKLR
jgi:hypothetical protein